MSYILLDFDRTLATYVNFETNAEALGAPVPAMLERLRRWREDGMEVRIFTARASDSNPARDRDMVAINSWLNEYIGESLLITNAKDFGCIAIWDDLAVAIEGNTGLYLGGPQDTDPLETSEELRLVGYSEADYTPETGIEEESM
jgi:hypothetical protein